MTHWQLEQLIKDLIFRVDRLETHQAKIREDLARLSGSPKKEGFKFQWLVGIAVSLYILWLLDREFVKVLAGFVTR